MRRFLALVMLLTILPAVVVPAEAVATVENAWSEAFARNDWAAMTSLYTEDATLYGSKLDLSVNRDGIRAYFEGLPKGMFKGAKFGEPVVRQVAADALTASGPLTFECEVDGKKSEIDFPHHNSPGAKGRLPSTPALDNQ